MSSYRPLEYLYGYWLVPVIGRVQSHHELFMASPSIRLPQARIVPNRIVGRFLADRRQCGKELTDVSCIGLSHWC